MSSVWLNKSKCLENLEKDEEALESYDKAIELEPENAEYYFAKTSLLFKLGLYEETY